MGLFGSYSGDEFLGLNLPKRKFLVDRILREKDSVMVIGGEKAGKSLLLQQLIFSLTNGETPFLDHYEIARECKVSLVAIEGELVDAQDRWKRMMRTLDFKRENFQLIFSEPLGLEREDNARRLTKTIEDFHTPDVLIFDPLYFCFNGSLSDDAIVRRFLGHIRVMKDRFNCAIIIVHHTHRIKFNPKTGKLVDEGDDAMFGSSALKWWPDHLLMFTFNKETMVRDFRCSTQRSGDILDHLQLKLVQPDPLYFSHLDSEDMSNGLRICEILSHIPSGLNANELCDRLNISKPTFYRDIKPAIHSGRVCKTETCRPVIYFLKM